MRRTLLLGATLALLAGGACRRPPRPPNVLLVSVDTLRADHCSLYGYPRPTTPRLDAFARAGVVFEQAYAPMATTAPSHATMFTGLLPRRHGVVKNGLVLGPHHDTLAERFARAGYRTGAVVSSFVVSRRFGLDQGFASYDGRFPKEGSTARNRAFEGEDVKGGFDQRADLATRKAVGWLARNGYLGPERPAAPFFLWVHYFDPHDPYVPPEAHLQPFATSGDDEHAALIAAYDGEVRFTDEQLGELLDSLARAGKLDDTLLVVTGDHGEGLMDHGHANHGIHLYEEAVRVPLVFRWPAGLAGARRVKAPVSLADLPATVGRLAGLPAAPPGDGVDLVPALRGAAKADPLRPIFLERREYATEKIGRFEIRGGKTALRLGQFKYIEAPEERSFELYELEADPAERENLLPGREKQAEAMARVLDEWRRRPGGARARGDATQETQEALRALGYVQ